MTTVSADAQHTGRRHSQGIFVLGIHDLPFLIGAVGVHEFDSLAGLVMLATHDEPRWGLAEEEELDEDHDDGKADAHEQRHSVTPLDGRIGPNILASP